ncbi:MAG: nucleoid-associated protein YgaU [Cognaticolwellia sp.]|jgi:nucleoid-associated protein YgaU
MGLMSFIKSAGRKVGFGKEEARKEGKLKAVAEKAADTQATESQIAEALRTAVTSRGLSITNFALSYAAGTATISGESTSTGDSEKCCLIVGNHDGVEVVDNRIQVNNPAPPAVYHTVVKGDTLSKIAKEHYGIMRLFETVFGANVPMITDPDEIYPGQVLRIPPTGAPKHIVAKGETLGKIAKHWYGDAGEYTRIATANAIDPNKLSLGQEISIPLISPKVGGSANIA